MPDPKKDKARKEYDQLQAKITSQWASFANVTGREAYEDLMKYIDGQREMFRKYAEDRAMPHPNPNAGGVLTLDNETVAALLQNSRGLNIVKTYISNRVNTNDVAPTKN